MVKFIFSKSYEINLCRIEDYIFSATESLESVEHFLAEHDQALQFVGENHKTPAIHPVTGDQSWVFGDGRYRLFFRCVSQEADILVHLTHIIDNKESNLDVYPNNKIPTYDED